MSNPKEIKTKEINKKGRKKEEEVSSKESKFDQSTILEEKSINLIPVMSREEVKEEKRKTRMNKASLVSLLILFGISIVIVGFSIISRIQLNYQKEKLFKHEEELTAFNQIIIENNQILERVALYNDVQKDRYPITKVINHIENILSKSAGSSLSQFAFSSSTGINFRGETRDLAELAKLWYLLANDPKLKEVNLKSFSKSTSSVSFTFEAAILLDEFIVEV